MKNNKPKPSKALNILNKDSRPNHLKSITIFGVIIVFIAAILAFTVEHIHLSQLVGIPGILLILFASYKSRVQDDKKQSRNHKYLIVFVATLQVALAATIINKHLLG